MERLPDEAKVLIQDPFSEFAYDDVGADRCRAKVVNVTKDGDEWYDAMTDDAVHEFIEDNQMTADETNNFLMEYPPAIIFYDLTNADCG